MAGQVTDEQVVAANVDVVFIVMGLDADFTLRRLERYLLLARESGAAPVILLTKPDLAPDVPAQVADVDGDGRRPRRARRQPEVQPGHRPGRCVSHRRAGPARCSDRRASARARSSTVSSARTCSKTREVRESDSKGRHTTTHRELVMLPTGGLIIDTPGMRELQLWDVSEAVRETFDDIEALARIVSLHRLPASRRAALRGEGGRRRGPSRGGPSRELPEAAGRAVGRWRSQQDERALLERKRQGRIGSKALKARLKDKRGG